MGPNGTGGVSPCHKEPNVPFIRSTTRVLLLCACLCGAEAAAQTSLVRLKKEADAVLGLGAVEAREKLDVVFRYARLSAEKGKLNEALKYYEAALRFHPLSFENQLAYAELLTKAGKVELARRRASLVARSSENDALVAKARTLLGQDVSMEIEPIARPKGDQPVLVLVPMGQVDILLLQEVRPRVAKALGIEVQIRKAKIKLPPPRRTPLRDFVAQIRRQLDQMKARSPDGFAALLKEEGFAAKDLQDDDKAVAILRALMARSGEEPARKFDLLLQHIRSQGDQWDAKELVEALWHAAKPYERAKARFVGVTRRDIFRKDYAFLLALRIGGYGVLSYRRYLAEFTDETPDRSRLLRRLNIQVINSAGHVYDLERCSDPTCPRSYAHSVAEHDKKGEQLCPKCKRDFDKAFGRKPKREE